MREWIYDKGISVWNDNIYNNYEFLMKSQYWSAKELYNRQLKMLQDLLSHAHSNSKFYRDKFENVGLRLGDINKLEDIINIPTVSKEEILANRDAIQIRKEGEKLYFAETSGSTGKPLVFFRDKDWDAWNRASLYRGYAWHNVKPWERNGCGFEAEILNRFCGSGLQPGPLGWKPRPT